ncbi:beta strand repeat-containing protein [Candidatus Mycoplasma mahonii]|uniref:beta strand repeat-containing protein n=1 Tax=Candidatus Mycoplasma mahonii TaxID=3004105 RepID=UPI0026F254D3|nr:hypothetical protein [Candidatus Mycoplasma mahonii]WKX02170.1 hypothetical protein O3I44_02085 [Candidatus Mycoplasma mahonii]
MSKRIKIAVCGGIGAIVTTAIAVPLLMMNNGDSVYITPGKKLVDAKIIESREYGTFKETFQDLKLGLTNINVTDMNDDGDNLVLTATGVLPRATVSTHASFIVQSAAAIQANPNTIKAIFNVVKATGEVTLLKLLESGSKESEAVIKAAITKNEVLNTTAMEQPTARMIDRITNPNKLTLEDKLSRVTTFESYFDSLPVTIFNEGVTADIDKAVYDQIKIDGVHTINASSNIDEMNFLFNAAGSAGSLKDVVDAGLVIYNNAIALANTAAKKANDQRHLDAEQARVNSLSSNGATAKSADAEDNGAFDNNAQSKYGITLGSVADGTFTYTYDASLTTITITAVLTDGASDLTVPTITPITLSPTPAENTATEAVANLLAAKTASRNAFTDYFDDLTITSLEGGAVDPSDAKAAYEKIKTDGLSSIDSATSIEDVDGLFSRTTNIGSLKTDADVGLIIYNAAIAKANDQRHLDAEQARVNNLVSNGAIAKSADAEDNGNFDDNAQIKYGITLGSVADGTFTYTYDASLTTITITAVLTDGASDLTVPTITPISLSPTPAENTETELLIAAQTESKAAFIAYFNALTITSLAGNAIPFAAQTTYENIKTNGLSSIDNALSIEDVEALFSTTNIGSLKTAADVGLETYNAAIAKANIDNDASLLTAARTASSEAFITYFDTLVTTSLEGDAIEPLAAKTTYENIKTNGLSSIDSATSIDEVNALFDGTTNIGSLKTNADTGLEIYNVAIANANRTASLLTVAKTKAKGFITTIVDGYATVDPANHDASLFGAIANAKTAADDAINDATDIAAVNILATSTTVGSEVAKVLEVIKAYEDSTGTIAIALENAKTIAKGFITTIVDGYATADPANHDASLFGAIANAKTEANDAIDDATSIVAVSALVASTTSGSEVAKVLEAIRLYEASTGTIAIAAALLIEAQTESKAAFTTYFDALIITIPNGAIVPEPAKTTYEQIKMDGLSSIDSATSINDVNALFSKTTTTTGSLKTAADVGLVMYNAAIAKANDQRHLDAEQARVNKLVSNGAIAKSADAEDNGNFDDNAQIKYGITLGSVADGTFTYTYDASLTTITITAVLTDGASDLTVPTITPISLSPTPAENTETELLIAAQTESKAAFIAYFDALIITIPNGAIVPEPAKTTYEQIKMDGLSSIDSATSINDVNALFSKTTNTGSLQTDADAGLIIYNDAIAKANDQRHLDAEQARVNNLVSIEATAKSADAEDNGAFDNNAQIKYGITLGSAVDGAFTYTYVASDRTIAITAVLTNGAGDLTIPLATSIDLSPTPAQNTATETTKLLTAAKTKSIDAFTTYFDGLDITPLVDDAIVPLTAQTTYENIKTDGLSSIDNALSIENVEALFSTTNTGSLKTAVDDGLEIYNAAIENANRTASLLTAAKTTAKRFITTAFETAPSQDDDAYDALLFGAIASAQTAANNAIDDATDIDTVSALASSPIIGTEVDKVLAAIKLYEDSTLKVNLAKFVNVDSSKDASELSALMRNSGRYVTVDELGIAYPILTPGVIAKYEIQSFANWPGKRAYAHVVVILTKGTETVEKKITVWLRQ